MNLDKINNKISEHLEAHFGDENEIADTVAGLLYMQRDLMLQEIEAGQHETIVKWLNKRQQEVINEVLSPTLDGAADTELKELMNAYFLVSNDFLKFLSEKVKKST